MGDVRQDRRLANGDRRRDQGGRIQETGNRRRKMEEDERETGYGRGLSDFII